MAVSPAERQYILAQIGKVASDALQVLWQQAAELSTGDFAAFVIEAFPELVAPYTTLAAETALLWYAASEVVPTDFVPELGSLPSVEQLTRSAEWALGGQGTVGLDRLQGTTQRAVYDSARSTIVENSDSEPGARWARYASANACAFCAMLATRGAVYTSAEAAGGVVGRGTEMSLMDRRIRAAGGTRRTGGRFTAGGVRARGERALGEKYHDHCHCVAIEVRPGDSYTPPDYVERWDDAYITATRETPGVGRYGAIDRTAVLAHMRESLGSH
ncbi:hypothetical protein [Nocardia sp. CA-290969]|uniref:VG15 protein n=1 Tax=Nocardia sp. CA-290969 TaxID=3239986 RepID=UPI003D8A002C